MTAKSNSTGVNTEKAAKEFRAAARSYVATHASNKAKARKTLVDLGIHTKTGRLTKNYK